MRSEIRIFNDYCPKELREKYENMLILALARMGYTPYLMHGDDGVAFNVDNDESVIQIKEKK